jgi:hypothetical protein
VTSQTRAVRYEVVVRGRLSERYANAFDTVQLEARDGQTALHSEVADQSQLYGLLNQLRDCGLELISVNPTAVPSESELRNER